jgi:O-antigen/teichoic acid export membrane protein
MYNLAGSIAPMFVSIVTVPIYLHLVGEARYGVLALVWAFLGYFGLFDPGLSRAAAYHIAKLRDAPAERRESVFWTAMLVNIGFGLAGGAILYFVARPLFMWAFKMPAGLRGEVMASLPWLAASVPVSIISGVLGGVLQAREWFGVANITNVLGMLMTQMTPLAVAYIHGPDLTWLIPAILVARAAAAIPAFIAVAKALPMGAGGRFDRSLFKTLFAYGGWITISNLVAPILTTIDRVLIGSVLSVQAVAFYSVPYNLVTRVSIVPGALANSIFPKLSRGARADSARLASNAVVALAGLTTPLVVVAIVALPLFMRLWVGAAFAAAAAPVGLILLLGVWINGLGQVPYGHLMASNRPDVVAKFHLIELLPFLAVLWLGLHFFGLAGAAWAWTLRVAADTVLLFGVAGHVDGWQKLVPGAAMVFLAPLCAPSHLLSYRTFYAAALVFTTLLWGWQVSPQIRGRFIRQFDRLSLRGAK